MERSKKRGEEEVTPQIGQETVTNKGGYCLFCCLVRTCIVLLSNNTRR